MTTGAIWRTYPGTGRNRHAPVVQQGRWLRKVVQGYYNYYAVPWNTRTLECFGISVSRHWLHALRRRSQRHRMPWKKYAKLVKLYIPKVKRLHDYPDNRFDAKHSR